MRELPLWYKSRLCDCLKFRRNIALFEEPLRELIRLQGHRIHSQNNSNGSAPQPLGKIATQTCYSDENCLTT